MPDITLKDIKKVVDEGFEKQAVFINKAFQTNQDYMDKRFGAVDKQFESLTDELKTDIQRVETKVDKALHTEYVNLEVRVKRIERKLELKPLNDSPQPS